MRQFGRLAELQHGDALRLSPGEIRIPQIGSHALADPQFLEALVTTQIVAFELLHRLGVERTREVFRYRLLTLYWFHGAVHCSSVHSVFRRRTLFQFAVPGPAKSFFSAE